MEKKKIAFFMKSNFAFDRIKVTFNQYKIYHQTFDVYPDHFYTYEHGHDLLQFWKPDLIVLDTKLLELDRLESLCIKNDIPHLFFHSDIESLLEQLNSHFELENIEGENEEAKSIEYIKDTNHIPEKVVVKDRIIEKEILRTEYTAMPNKLIIVSSLWDGAGSTTLSINLARAISERGVEVSYVEHPLAKPYMFDYLSIPLQEEIREKAYIDIVSEIKEKQTRNIRNNVWRQKGINWLVTDSRNEPLRDFSYEELLQYIYSVPSIVTILDISANLHDPSITKLLPHADEIYVCIEPDPVKIDWLTTIGAGQKDKQRLEQQNISLLNDLENQRDIKYQLVMMKHTTLIKKDEWLTCFEKEPICYFPSIPYDHLVKSVWDSTFIYDHEDYHPDIDKALKPLIAKTLPRNFYNKVEKPKKKSLLNILGIGAKNI